MNLTKAKTVFLSAFVIFVELQLCIADNARKHNRTNDNFNFSDLDGYTWNEAIPRNPQERWRNLKFPVRPPRLRNWKRNRTTTTSTTTRTPISTAINTTITEKNSTSLKKSLPEKIVIQESRRRIDLIDSSSSEHHPLSVVWPLRLRPGQAKRFRIPTPTTPAPQVLLKLLQPKPTRPAIYSLDGFVPKPSIKKISSTTKPPYNDYNSKSDLQQVSSTIRRRKVNRFSKHEDEDDYNENEPSIRRKKPVSRYTAFARKGIPGQDYPVFNIIPQTEFQCSEQPGPGFYADQYTNCQVWHMCPGGQISPRHSFLCPNGTIFNQKKRICDWWYNVDCKKLSRNKRSEYSEYLFDIYGLFENLFD